MNSVVVGSTDIDLNILDKMFQLRDKVFCERLGWEVESNQGRERDWYDDLDPVYIISRTPEDNVEGCWRILPTTGPYMLADTFPTLLHGQNPPRAPDTWELSRFAVSPASEKEQRQGSFHPVTMQMIRGVFSFAKDHDITNYVTVISVGVERLLRRAGFPLERLGPSQRIGKVGTVACFIPVNEQFRQAAFAA
ncbi:MAG: acyl-homoserine-lactone synthase [Gammaproteobacteria bacterium]